MRRSLGAWRGADSGDTRISPGFLGTKPAAMRAASDSPPQNPNSRCSRAQARHSGIAAHAAQTTAAYRSLSVRSEAV